MPRNDSLNYSKWDKIGDSSSEDDEPAAAQPRVTRLDQPSTVTTAADGSITIAQQQPTDSSAAKAKSSSATTVSNTTKTNAPADGAVPASWTEKGAFVNNSDKQHEDDDDNPPPLSYYWSQDRLTVNVRILLPPQDDKGTSWSCTVENILPYRDRQAAVMGSDRPQRLVVLYQKTIRLQGDLSHAVHLAEEEDTVDWSIEHYNNSESSQDSRYILVTLYKATPLAGLALWWKKLLQQERDEIALDWVDSSKNNAFQQAWDEAHTQFRANRQAEQQQHSV